MAALAGLLSACSAAHGDATSRIARPGAVAGRILTLAIGRPASVDPANSFEQWGRLVDSLICEPLIQIDPVTGDPKPAIAQSWIVSANGTKLTLKLRKGLHFSDGRSVTADDVAYSLSRVASEEQASNVADLLRPVFGWEEVHGDVEPKTPEHATQLAGVGVVGTDAVQLSLSAPRADFYRVLAEPLSAPVPRAAVTKDPSAFEANPVCAGPYKLVHPWDPGDASISLARFEGYYGRNTGYARGGRGYADRIELHVLDPSDAPSEVAAGRADAALLQASIAPRGTRVVTNTTPYLEYIGLPVTVPPFERREVRIALSQAIDRAAIARDVYGRVRAPAGGFLAPSLGAMSRRNACGPAAPATQNVIAARRTLEGAGIDLMERNITMSYNPDFQNRSLVEAVARQWESAFGLHVALRSLPWSRYLEAGTAPRGFDGAFRLGWKPTYAGPDPALAPLFTSANIGRDNMTRFNDPRFDRILDRTARKATSEEDLRNAYQRLEDILCEQMPAIPVVFGGARAVVSDRIGTASGSFFDITSGSLDVREIYVRTAAG
ncbi:MAG: ABC transporter substrate-binding protein [Actinomycetota bacterium]|nr:ABC transporter substrate-binding protein [Actinomycetota bacterium]